MTSTVGIRWPAAGRSIGWWLKWQMGQLVSDEPVMVAEVGHQRRGHQQRH
jgi:hypothetical protein